MIRIAAVMILVMAALPVASPGQASANSNLIEAPAGAALAVAGTPQAMQIVAGDHTCALTPVGGVVCWGPNDHGRLGDGTTNNSAVPVAVQGLSSGVMSVAPGGYGTCTLTALGRVFCWGISAVDLSSSSVPVEVTGLGHQVVQLAVSGGSHTCALTSSGKVLCWGANSYGQLGDGTFADSPTPVVAIAANAVQIAVYELTSCAVMTNGEVLCWGWNPFGQLGNGTTGVNSGVPVNVLKLVGGTPLTGASQVGLGTDFGCALVGSGVYCWGRDMEGELGDGQGSGVRPFANPVTDYLFGPPLSGADQLSVGSMHACVHLSSGEVKCWGWNSAGQIGIGNRVSDALVPAIVLDPTGTAPLEGVTQVTAGSAYTCIFTNWEAVHPFYCWGANSSGQLGIGSMNEYQPLPRPVADISGLGSGEILEPQIVAGGSHTCSLTTGEGLKCWGANTNGQLGDGTTTDRLNPVEVAGLSSGVKSMALGDNFTCALLPWGRLKCWGENTHGQLGNGDKTDSPLPVMASLPDMVRQVAAGSGHTCVLTLAGSVLCWGDNTYGQLGNGNTAESTTPVVAIADSAVEIGLGGSTSCAVLSGGGLKCWGLGDLGQLGEGGSGAGHKQVSATDVQVSAGAALADATQVAVGSNFACALLSGGLVDCWGKNDVGQLGQGITSPLSAYAVPVVTEAGGDPLQGATQVTAGGAHACVRMYTDRLKCWGQGESGQLGDGTSGSGIYSDIPYTVVDHYAPFDPTIPYLEVVSQVSAGGGHTCAFLKWDGTNPYRCWGDNSRGQLGDGGGSSSSGQKGVRSLANRPYPNPPLDSLNFGSPPLAKIAAGGEHTCALTGAGGVKCWGDNHEGQLGDGTWNGREETPASVVGLSSGVDGLAAGGYHTCALTSVGGVKCWGKNDQGQLGDANNTKRNIPVDVSDLGSGVIELAAGYYHTCALLSDGGVKCWGWNYYGQLGNSTNISSNIPVIVTGLSSGVIGLVAGTFHTCALTSVGGVKCWGNGSAGRLGNDAVTNSNIPVDVVGLGSGVIGLTAADGDHTCAQTSGGGVKCWGANYYGELGDGTNVERHVPVDVVGLSSGTILLAAGGNHTCALTSAGEVKCWGNNDHGQLGDGTNTNSNIPVDVSELAALKVTSLSAGFAHTCAVVSGTGPLRCWGSNSYGQLGTGDTSDTKGPVISKWLTAAGLVEDNKTEVIVLPHPNNVVVVPAQPIETSVVVTATEVTSPPAPCTNCVPVPFGYFNWDDWCSDQKPMCHLNAFLHAEYLAGTGGGTQFADGITADDYNESTLNLYKYVDGTWVPMLPCTGCLLDTVNHVLIASLDGSGIYAMMAGPLTGNHYIYLPIVMR